MKISMELYTLAERFGDFRAVEIAKEAGFDVSPLSVTINGQSYREFDEISAEEFVDIILQGHLPISSQPAENRKVPAGRKINTPTSIRPSRNFATASKNKFFFINFKIINVIYSIVSVNIAREKSFATKRPDFQAPPYAPLYPRYSCMSYAEDNIQPNHFDVA